MSRKSAIPIVACFVAAAFWAGMGRPAHASEVRPVTMTLQAVSVTNDWWYTAVFLVTNAGTRPAQLTSCGCSFSPNIDLPLGLFGHCDVPPRTNCTMRVTWQRAPPGPTHGPISWRFAVFEQSSTLQKTKIAARRLEANVLGKAHYTNLWMSDLWSPAYEITSPIVLKLPELPSPVHNSLTATDAEQPLRRPLPFFRLNNAGNNREESSSAQLGGSADGSQPVRSETNRTSSAAGSRR
jgi:hypothetical protein